MSKLKCLIVDDLKDSAFGTKNILTKLSQNNNFEIEFIVEHNAYDAICTIDKNKDISVFILDYNLQDGQNADIIIESIQRKEKLVFLISGYEYSDLCHIIQTNPNIFLSKRIK